MSETSAIKEKWRNVWGIVAEYKYSGGMKNKRLSKYMIFRHDLEEQTI